MIGDFYRHLRRIALGAILISGLFAGVIVSATSIREIQDQIDQTKNDIENFNEKIDSLSDEQDLIEEKIDDLNAEIINTMTSIEVKEEELSQKEDEIALKAKDIEEAEKEYENAKNAEEKRYKDMVLRLRAMYEYNMNTTLGFVLQGDGLSGMLNRLDYVESIYEYDRNKFEEYRAMKQAVKDLWDQLELDKASLEDEREVLNNEKASLETQKSNLDAMLAQKKRESANYDAEIAKYKQEVAVAKKKLQQDQTKLKQLQAQQAANNRANASYATTDYTKIIDNASGSTLGKQIAKYACQYVGNPYVAGGTSLTNGADCSGFTYRVFADFGYKLPRTSFEQRSAGTGVDYDSAQPGDIICYDGHVAIYIGGGYIVHASSAKTGIKVSKAGYRSILAVRRIIN
ncbi:MAG: C40 family peptidase [Acetatifactor sp.]|nr:C40 family peptidase [Acetatifactor sp.]